MMKLANYLSNGLLISLIPYVKIPAMGIPVSIQRPRFWIPEAANTAVGIVAFRLRCVNLSNRKVLAKVVEIERTRR